MLFSTLLRMACLAIAIRSANLLRSVSRTAASYRGFQSELESLEDIEITQAEIVAWLAVTRNSSKVVAVGGIQALLLRTNSARLLSVSL
jgi:hypothetical protein